VTLKGQKDAQFQWKARQSQMALIFLGLVGLKMQNRTKSTGTSVKYQYFCRVVSIKFKAV
jgi:hypothetical protein